MATNMYDHGDKELYGLITQHCWDNILVDSNCQLGVLAKLMGYLLISGSLAVKAPQIVKILSAKSVAGLSPFSFYSELVIFIVNAVYHIVKGSPFSAYGEILTILAQIVILVILMWIYMDNRPSSLGIAGLIAFFIGTAAACAAIPEDYLIILPLSNIPLVVMSKGPQILTNFQNGHTGQLAAITTAMNYSGTVVRIFTTIQEVGWDMSLVVTHALSSALNGLLLLQVVMFWDQTNRWSRKQSKTKVQ